MPSFCDIREFHTQLKGRCNQIKLFDNACVIVGDLLLYLILSLGFVFVTITYLRLALRPCNLNPDGYYPQFYKTRDRV